MTPPAWIHRLVPRGGSLAPAAPASRPRFTIGTGLFLRTLAVVHFIAFLSIWTQLAGLIGPHGLLPAAPYLAAVHDQLGAAAYFQLPTLCWLFGTGRFLDVLCALGLAGSVLLFAGIAPAFCLALLWAGYLSLVNVGQIFLGFQWDALLLESTLLAIFLVPWSLRPGWRLIDPPRLARWLLLWLLFRLMLLSGVVKLSSGDPAWHDLTALTFHFETQPLPNPLAWWVHQLPAAVLRAACAGLFAIELFVPCFLFAPRTIRHRAALLLIALQLAIALTGNYAFFNLLTIALCLPALDDAFWSALLPAGASRQCHIMEDIGARRRPWVRGVSHAAAGAVVLYTSLLAGPSFDRRLRWPAWFDSVVGAVAPFASLNSYGLFAVMTKSRPELIFEGSNDRRDWLAYEFPDKPGDLARRPPIVAPYQPRLDWQLWFAALGAPEQNRWVLSLCEHLLRGTPEVLALLARNPFPAHSPRYVRVVRYDYRFTTAAGRARTGHWWRRTPLDFYVEPVSLR